MSNRWNKLSSTRFTITVIAFTVFIAGAFVLISLGKYPEIQKKLIDWAGYTVLGYIGLRTFRGSMGTTVFSGLYRKFTKEKENDELID